MNVTDRPNIHIPATPKPTRYAEILERTRVDSPFDAGRKPCPQGGEDRWSARWLMEQLGYPRWQDFEPVIERAKTTAHNEGFNVRTLFRINPEKSGGRPRVDYQVTRYAAYLIAMNGDTRKQQVSDAQHYFAVRTREAETAVSQTAPAAMPTHAQALRGWAEQLERAEAAEAARDIARARAAELEDPAAAWNHLAKLSGDYSVGDAAKILSNDPNINIGQNRLFAFLAGDRVNGRDIGNEPWILRSRRHGCWRVYQEQVNLGRLKQRPSPHATADREGHPVVVVTVKGIAELHKRLGGCGYPAPPGAQLSLV